MLTMCLLIVIAFFVNLILTMWLTALLQTSLMGRGKISSLCTTFGFQPKVGCTRKRTKKFCFFTRLHYLWLSAEGTPVRNQRSSTTEWVR